MCFFIRERTCEVPNHPPEIMNEFYPLLGEMILTAMLRDSDDEAGAVVQAQTLAQPWIESTTRFQTLIVGKR